MALNTDAAMVMYYDIAGDPADHDDWHTYEHIHERLSIPGFVRVSRWTASGSGPRYLVIYELADIDMATAPAYLERLNHPSAWTAAMMPRFRGMVRGFCSVVAGAGFGLGNTALSLRFTPMDGAGSRLREWLSDEVLPAMASRRGMAGVYLLQPSAPPPMTREQSIRGQDAAMNWLLLATAYDAKALERAADEHLDAAVLAQHGAGPTMTRTTYALHYTASAQEVAQSVAPPVLSPAMRQVPGVRQA